MSNPTTSTLTCQCGTKFQENLDSQTPGLCATCEQILIENLHKEGYDPKEISQHISKFIGIVAAVTELRRTTANPNVSRTPHISEINAETGDLTYREPKEGETYNSFSIDYWIPNDSNSYVIACANALGLSKQLFEEIRYDPDLEKKLFGPEEWDRPEMLLVVKKKRKAPKATTK